MSLVIEKEHCYVCEKSVYPQEKLNADSRIYHKACFRCKKCAGVLKLGSYASMDGEVFCKVCFKKNFFTKGNYSEGFGKLKPQEQHDLKTGKSGTLPVSSSFRGFDQLRLKEGDRDRSETIAEIGHPSIEFEDTETREQREARERRRMELLELEENRKRTMEEEIRKREERRKQELSRIEEQRRAKAATEFKEDEDRKRDDQIKQENRKRELILVEENRKKLEEQKRRDDEDRRERERKQKEEAEEKKKQYEAYRVQKERDDEKKREEAEQSRIARERAERKRIEEEQMREDEERRKKLSEEAVFTPKSDVKFNKPTIGGRGVRRLLPTNAPPGSTTVITFITATTTK